MYVLTVEVEIDPAHVEDYRGVIVQQARISKEREPGCLVFDVARSPDSATRFLLYEVYTDRAAFDFHVQQPHSQQNGASTKPWILRQQISVWTKVS